MTATRQILATKLLAPLPTTTLVARPRFIDRLHDALRRPLTAVIAPPGFGKTTLVSSWIANVNPNGFAPIVLVLDDYHEISTPASHTNRAADEDKVFSLCQHDQNSIREDPEMSATEAIFRYGQARGLRIMTYCDYYEECRQSLTVLQIAME